MGGGLGRVARQRPSRFSAKVAESPPVSPVQLSPDALTYVPDWVTTYVVETTDFGTVTVLV